jgi:RHS repeat-associated protein
MPFRECKQVLLFVFAVLFLGVGSASAQTPTITSIYPTTGPVGMPVQITGTNFGSTGAVTLNGTAAKTETWSATTITAIVPSGASSGTFAVTVGGLTGHSTTFTITLLPSTWTDADIGTVGSAGSGTFASGTFSVNSSGQQIGSVADGLNFAYQSLSGDGTIVARVTGIQGSAGSATAGIMIRETLGPGATTAYVGYLNSGADEQFDVRASTGASMSPLVDAYISMPVWLMLVRSGNTISAYSSASGYEWTQMSTAQSVTMAQNVYVGLAVASGNTANVATATFDNVSINSAAVPAPIINGLSATTGAIGAQVIASGSNFGSQTGLVLLNGVPTSVNSWTGTSVTITIPTGATSGFLVVSTAPGLNDSNPIYFEVTTQPLPNPWDNQDIGVVGATGTATFSNRIFLVSSSGPQIGGTADGMQFVYQLLSGDGTIIARVVGIGGAAASATAGIMIRETLNPGAIAAYVGYLNSGADEQFDVRASTGASMSPLIDAYTPLPVWLMLVRTGNTISAYTSASGYEWTQMSTAQSVTMAQNIYVGLAVASGSTSNVATATFDNVSVSSVGSPAPLVTGLSATTGSIGSSVIISGVNFGSQSGLVTLNGTPTTVNSWTTTSITITIPTGATSGLLAVCVTPSMNFSNQIYFEVTSQPLPTSWANEDIGAVGQTGNATYSAGTYSVTSTGQIIGNTADGMQFVYEPMSGNGSIVARVVSFQGATSSATAGIMIRETLNQGATTAFLGYLNSGTDEQFDTRTSTGASMTPLIDAYVPLPVWIMLVRNGSSFSAYVCSDGLNWVQMGSTQTITMAQNVYVGLAVASGSTTSSVTATFDNVSISYATAAAPVITRVSATTGSVGGQVIISGLGFGVSQGASSVLLHGSSVTINSWSNASITMTIPTGAVSGPLAVAVAPTMNESNPVVFTVTTHPLPTPWLDQEIGTLGIAGSATASSGVFAVNASGSGVSGTSDGIHFVYQPLTGDGSIVARIVSAQSGPTIAGVMIRETLNPSATDIGTEYWGTDTEILIDERPSTGASGAPGSELPGNVTLPYWVKLQRSGNVFSAYASSNGSTWVQVGTGQTVSMASNAYVGLVVSSDNNSSLATATFDNVSVTAGLMPFVGSLSPSAGPVGTSVTIGGSSFGTTQGTVTFNGVAAASITSWANTQIVATVPTTVTTGPVIVTASSTPSNSTVSFTAFNPVITSLAPPAAETGGLIDINGSGFGPPYSGGTVQFNGIAAQLNSWSDTLVTALVPIGSTTGPVKVTMNGITSNGVQFTLASTLAITALSAPSGSIGQSITITGTGFGGTQSDSVVTFNGVPATVTTWGSTSIVAIVPPGASTGPVTVDVANVIAQGPVFSISSLLTLTDSLGHQTTYASVMVGGKWYVNNSQGSGCSSCTVRGSIQNQYDGFGNVTLRTDELSHTISYTYDSNQNLLTVSAQAGSGVYATTTYTYNSFGEPLTVTDPLGNVTTNAYDANGNLVSVTTPAPNGSTPASVTQFAYNSLGEMTQITDPLGRITKLAYTSAGLIYTITDAQNNVTTYAYDSRGNRTSVTDAMTNQTTFAYDSGSRLTTITYPGSATTVFAYDYRGRRISVTDQNSKKTTYAYDDADRLTSVTDPANNVTNYTYDTENNLVSIEDANSHTTTFSYDAYGRIMETTFPSTHFEQYGYDAANNLTSKTDRNSQTINYVYDDLYRLTQKTYPDSSTVEYVYDLVGKLQQVTDPTGTYGLAYDNMGRLVGSTTKYTFLSTTTYSNSYTYDANSNRASMTDPQSGVTSYVYDTLNRLSTLTPPTAFGTGSFGFTYDALSRRTQMTRPNGVTSNYTYNNLSQLLSVLHQVGASTIDGAVYTVDPAGNRMAKTDKHANVTSNYTYDPLYELTQVTQSTTTTESYTFDPVGNRLTSLGVSPYSVNTSNELTAIPGTTNTYDNNGNTLTKVTSAGTTTYGWDYENRLTSVTLPGTGGTLTFKYDAFGRRVQKAFTQGSTTTTTNYLYDVNNAVVDVDQNGNALARYAATQNGDEPLAELRSATTSYYSQDGLGSVTSLTTSAGALANAYTYDSFGKSTASSGAIVNRFEYTGRELDPETGLYFYRARYFDPNAGRFLSEDPIAFRGGIDFYSYVRNNPVNLLDPTGLTPQAPDPNLPTVPTGKAGCRFEVRVVTGAICDNCVYICRGYAGKVVVPQAVGKPCPSINPVSGLVNTNEVDPKCLKPPCNQQPQTQPLGAPLLPFIIDILEDLLVFAGAAA